MRALVAVLLALALAARAIAAASVPAPPRPSRSSRAPKAPAWSAADLRRLRARSRGPLGRSALATSGIAIVDARGRPLFLRRERTAATPASTFKLLAAVTALQTLGPDYRFETRLETLDVPHDGTLDGDLYLVGDGDPSLTVGRTARRRRWVARAQRHHRHHRRRRRRRDAFGGREINPAWDPDDLQYDYAAGHERALDRRGYGRIPSRARPRAGAPARIEVRPPSEAVRVRGGVMTGYATTLSIDRAADRNDFTFAGDIAVGAEQSFYRPVIDQPLYVAGVADTMLRQRDVQVAARPRTGIAPLVATVALAPPLGAAARRCSATCSSSRTTTMPSSCCARSARTRARSGPRPSGRRGRARGARAAGSARDGLHVVDGSGLAPSDRVRPDRPGHACSRASTSCPPAASSSRDLPRVGIEGTVRRHDVTTALGRARAKSGHIDDVDALAGYVDTRRHGRVAFAIWSTTGGPTTVRSTTGSTPHARRSSRLLKPGRLGRSPTRRFAEAKPPGGSGSDRKRVPWLLRQLGPRSSSASRRRTRPTPSRAWPAPSATRAAASAPSTPAPSGGRPPSAT